MKALGALEAQNTEISLPLIEIYVVHGELVKVGVTQ